MDELNPQARQMADESMVRCLQAQTQAIWPQEEPLLRRYALPQAPQILDAGCGTGEATGRLAELFPGARVLGIDIVDAHLELARAQHAALAPRLSFAHQSVYQLAAAAGSFDLTVCRHVMHAIPHPERVLAELLRVTRHGGYLHLIAEDYGMLHFQTAPPPTAQPQVGQSPQTAPVSDREALLEPYDFWHQVPRQFARATGTDLHLGRNIYALLAQLPLAQIAIDYVVVDTLRVPRATFAAILQAWRDGYAEPIGELTTIDRNAAADCFDRMIATIRDPCGYAAWMVPVVSGRVR